MDCERDYLCQTTDQSQEGKLVTVQRYKSYHFERFPLNSLEHIKVFMLWVDYVLGNGGTLLLKV